MEPTALKSATHPKDTLGEPFHASPEADSRALDLLRKLTLLQAGLPRSQALAWERVFFAEAFADPEPGRRVRAFLEATPEPADRIGLPRDRGGHGGRGR